MEKASVKPAKQPKQPKLTERYETVEAFRKAMLKEAIAATKHIDWDQVLANAQKAK